MKYTCSVMMRGGGVFMAIVQDAYDIPNDIETGLATGLYSRVGSVVRYATGPNKGQIVKHLKPVDLRAVEQTQVAGSKLLQLAQKYKKEAGIAAVGVALIGVGVLSYDKWKNHEPKVLKTFHSAFATYIDAIRNGNMEIDIINALMDALEALKQHKDYEKIKIQLTANELEVLVGRIHDYTIKLATDNNVELAEDELNTNDGVIINLQSYLKMQQRIFEEVA